MFDTAHGLCGCEACRGAAVDLGGPGPDTVPEADKPIWTLEQVIAQQLRWDVRWAAEPIPYTFYTKAPPHLENNKDYTGFTAFTAAQKAATRHALATIADVVPLQFVEVSDNQLNTGPGNRRLTYAASQSTEQYFTAYASLKASQGNELGDMKRIYAAEMLYNGKRWVGDADLGSREYYVIIHETLHSLGIPHPGDYNRSPDEEIQYAKHAEYAQDSAQYSVMSYFSEKVTGASFNGLFASTPLLHDIAVLHALYGPDQSTRTGDTVYGFNSNAGGAYDLAANVKGSVFCIWDAGGADTIDLSGYSTASTIDLNPGAFSSGGGLISNISIAFGAAIERGRGGAGADTVVGNGLNNVLWGEGGDDFVDGRGGADEIFGGAGADRLLGGGDRDRLLGDAGDDQIEGGDGDDFMDGGSGRDNLFGDADADHMIGGGDGDRLHGQDGDDLIGGQDGDDFIDGGSGRDNLFGDGGGDHLVGGVDNDRLHGNEGDDLIGGQDGDDYVEGGSGRDNLFGDAGGDHIVGGSDADRLHGQDGDDLMGGQDGDDFIDGGSGRDNLFGDAGGDHIVGGGDGDRLHGQDGDDLIGGQDGDDFIDGGGGRDTLFGDGGADVIFGGAGADILVGQGGADVFVFVSVFDSLAGDADRVLDFEAGDRIDISGIDADLGLAGDQAFSLFSDLRAGRAGQAMLSFDAASDTTSLRLDVDGDAAADFVLILNGRVEATAPWAL